MGSDCGQRPAADALRPRDSNVSAGKGTKRSRAPGPPPNVSSAKRTRPTKAAPRKRKQPPMPSVDPSPPSACVTSAFDDPALDDALAHADLNALQATPTAVPPTARSATEALPADSPPAGAVAFGWWVVRNLHDAHVEECGPADSNGLGMVMRQAARFLHHGTLDIATWNKMSVPIAKAISNPAVISLFLDHLERHVINMRATVGHRRLRRRWMGACPGPADEAAAQEAKRSWWSGRGGGSEAQ